VPDCASTWALTVSLEALRSAGLAADRRFESASGRCWCARVEIAPLHVHQARDHGGLALRDVSLQTVAQGRPRGGRELLADAVALVANGGRILDVEPAVGVNSSVVNVAGVTL
jgi:hypothetical protein